MWTVFRRNTICSEADLDIYGIEQMDWAQFEQFIIHFISYFFSSTMTCIARKSFAKGFHIHKGDERVNIETPSNYLYLTAYLRITFMYVNWMVRKYREIAQWGFFITQWNPPIVFPIDHDDVIKWKHFPRYWPFVRGIHRSPKGQWGGTLMFSLICALNIRLSKLSWSWRFETPSRPLWRHCNDPLALPWRGDMGFHYEFKVWSKFTCVFRTVTLCATSCYEWAC